MTDVVKHEPKRPEHKAMWAYMKSVTKFTHAGLKAATSVSDFARTNYVGQLKAVDLLREVGWEDGKKYFTVHSDVELSDMTGERRKTIEGKIWLAIRSLVNFTPEDISAVLIADEPAATTERVNKYINVLMKGRYLVVVGPARPNVCSARYKLAKNTGPLPPIMQRRNVVVDTNRECVVHVEGVRL